MLSSLTTNAMINANYGLTILAQREKTGPRGEEFGKAAPIGLFVILGLLLVVLLIGFNMNKRIRVLERRRAFAEQHGIDLFDHERLEAAMKAAGYDETAKTGTMFARTEVPKTDERFEPISGISTGAEAIDAERGGVLGKNDDNPLIEKKNDGDQA